MMTTFALYYPSTRSKPNIVERDQYGIRVRYVAEFYVEADAAMFLDSIHRAESAEAERDTLRAQLAAEEAAHRDDVAALRAKLEQARKALTVISATVAGLEKQSAPVVKRSIKEIQGWTSTALIEAQS